ncbi:MAG: RluA family pseudouridine synthase [Puniceicoccales bacterium]|jgi:23S rRNA pseudouridine1911/1915/1917 synthase|nr:RluA family pseudouridine synthase [Puniceicoccales bacterium]
MGDAYEFAVENMDVRQRVDKFLSAKICGISRTAMKKSFEYGLVSVNGFPVAAKYVLHGGECVKVIVVHKPPTLLEPVSMDLEILFEDDEIIVINKPPGVIVHRGNGTVSPTLVEGVLSHCKLSTLGGDARPGVVHRLDKETSGAIIFAKTDGAYLELVKMFGKRKVKKTYRAIVSGIFEKNFGEINQPVGRHRSVRTKMAIVSSGKEAITRWLLVETFGKQFSHVKANILTGRTHQIRVHMANARHPIVGDMTYGYKHSTLIAPRRVMLHAHELEFEHPSSGKNMKLCAPLPNDFCEILCVLGEIFCRLETKTVTGNQK